MSERDQRRWIRLTPDSLTESTVQFLSEGRWQRCALLDLSPAGVALAVSAQHRGSMRPGERVRLRVRFRGLPRVELPAHVLRDDGVTGGPGRVALRWLQDPPSWDGRERREFPRLGIARDDGFSVRIANDHLLGLWTRASILDVSADRGIRIEGVGGPIWMMPGMLVDVHLDLPVLREAPLRCQVLWVRPDAAGRVQAGLRALDLEAPALQALDEWIAMSGLWSPRLLVSLGFEPPSIPGQYRFRSAEARRDRDALLAHLAESAGPAGRIGFEGLPPLPREPATELGLVGCWDGDRLVASLALDLSPERSGGSPDEIVLAAAGFETDWFEQEILRGLWSQLLRVFLASGRLRLRLWCPEGRQKLYAMLGLEPDAEDGWWHLRRETVLVGTGLSPVAWAWVYGEASGYHARQGARLHWRKLLARFLRISLNAVLAEILLPRLRRRTGTELRRWCEEATAA